MPGEGLRLPQHDDRLVVSSLARRARTVTLQAHTDSGPLLFAYGSIIDNTSGDPVFFAGE